MRKHTPLHFIGLYATKKVPNLTRRSSRLSLFPKSRKSIAATFCRLSSALMDAECNLGRVQRAGRREARQASLELGSVVTLPFFVPENPKSNEVRTMTTMQNFKSVAPVEPVNQHSGKSFGADLDDIARQIETLGAVLSQHIVPRLPICGGGMAESWKACRASLKAAASALRAYQAQEELFNGIGGGHE